jgi:GTPase Era involved in 16S rRNA processing
VGRHIHLELRVQVRRHWRADERVLDRLGIE